MEKLALYAIGYLGAFLIFIAALADNIISILALLSLGLGLFCVSILILVSLKQVEYTNKREREKVAQLSKKHQEPLASNCGK